MDRFGVRPQADFGACSRVGLAAAILSLLAWATALAQDAGQPQDDARLPSVERLRGLSIEQLAQIQVTSVSRSAEPLEDAPSAIYVITHDEIMRSDATSLPEILRLAPNLEVALITASSYAITARGFNGNAADKLLVLVDGRSVYTPLFGGVEWDEQDILPQDIDRIEVISGPGATLWGANAVNGVVNIVTRKASDTPGGDLDLSAGSQETRGSLQYGGRIDDDLSYRVYAEDFSIRGDRLSTGAPANDGWAKAQGGFRLDWAPPGPDSLTVEGDLFHGSEGQLGAPNLDVLGGHIQADWQRQFGDGSSLDVLSYFDDSQRFADGVGFWLRTYDLELQDNLVVGDRQQIVWGAGVRLYQSRFQNGGAVAYLPPDSVEPLADVYAQDTVTLTRSLDLIAGLKLEKDPFAGVSALPNARLAWKPARNLLLWAAASRAVRAPTLFDEDLHDTLIPSVLILEGDRRFHPETLTALELGARAQVTDKVSLSVSTYYNIYDDLRSLEWVRMNALPLLVAWGNLMDGRTYGLETWGEYQAAPWWRLRAGFVLQHLDLGFKPGASALNDVDEAGDDPASYGSVQSTVSLYRLTWTADLRYVGALPDPRIPSYGELNSSLNWAVTKKLELYVAGENLLNPYHLEYEEAGAAVGTEVPRTISVGTRLRF